MSSHTISHVSRNLTLDMLRAVAIIVIILNHTHVTDTVEAKNVLDYGYNGLIGFFALFNQGGWVAVDMFFVLSGFLVSGLLFNEYKHYHKLNVKSFLIRRGFKIYPSFIFFIFSTFLFEMVVHRFIHNQPPVFTESLKDLAFLHNYLGGRWGHTWSIDVEEFFYLTIPFFVYFLIKQNAITLKAFVFTYLFLMVFGVIDRALIVYHSPVYDFGEQYMKTHFRLDGLFLGVLISYIYNYRPAYLNPINNNKIVFTVVTALLIAVNFYFKREDNLWEAVVMLAVNPVSFGLMLILSLNFIKNVNSKLLVLIGQCSYSIYLWHFFFGDFLGRLYFRLGENLNKNTSAHVGNKVLYLSYVGVYICSSIGFGILMCKLIEGPTLRIRDKYFPSKTRNIITHIPG